jgi:ketosteroid isomerase-like protein
VRDVESRVRAIYERFNAGDVEGAAALFHPDVILHDAPELPGGRSFHGRGDIAQALGNLREMFDGPIATVEDVRTGDAVAVALVRVRGKGASSGVPIEAEVAYVFSLRGPEIVEVQVFLSHAAGLEAAGLQSS